ncbi:MAG: signal peptidase II [Gemmatimonadota bacterium]
MKPDFLSSIRARWFWALAAAILLTDCATKRVAEIELAPANIPHPVVGDVVRLTLAYNQGSAMSLWTGPEARVLLSLFAVVALAVMVRLYRGTPSDQRVRIAGLALVVGGAAGNLLDRIRSPRGVVDFIDVGFGSWRFWVFNVADIGVTIGAVLLAWAISQHREASPLPAPSP